MEGDAPEVAGEVLDPAANAGHAGGAVHGDPVQIIGLDLGDLVVDVCPLRRIFAYVDKALDFLLSVGLRPFIQLGFMPEALSKENVHRFRYSISAPASYDKWCVMIDQLIAEKIVSRRSGSAFDQWVAMGAMELTTQEEFENLACRSVPAISRYKAATQDGKLPIEALLDMLEVRLVTVEPLS